MIRAFDNVATGPYRIAGTHNGPPWLREFTIEQCEQLVRNRMPVVIADEVIGQEPVNMATSWLKGVPIIPPFGRMWIEAATPFSPSISSIGIGVNASMTQTRVAPMARWGDSADLTRILTLAPYLQFRDGRCLGPIWLNCIGLDQVGRVAFKETSDGEGAPGIQVIAGALDPHEHASLCVTTLRFAITVLVMFHASNARVHEVGGTQDRISKSVRRLNRFPELRHRVLQFQQGDRWVRADGSDGQTGIGGFDHRKALHWRMGHVKDHRKHGMFGDPDKKVLVYVPAHLVGDPRKGMVTKDYEVSAPKEGQAES